MTGELAVRDAAGHEWRRDARGRWWGCYACDPDDVQEWGAEEIAADAGLTIDDVEGRRRW